MVARRPIMFKRGDSSPFIADAQEMLTRLGFDPGEPRGVFVSKTEDAVRAFQREYGLDVTGVLDHVTLRVLYEEADPLGYPSVLMEAPTKGGTPAESPPSPVAERADGGPLARAGAQHGGRSIVISVGERALGLYEDDRLVRRYPVAVGKPSTPTPVGTHKVIEKVMYPGGGLGTRWMAFTRQMHGIHGTNRPELIGQAVSNGCVRMYNQDVEELYDLVDIGTPVIVMTGPVASWPSLRPSLGTADGASGRKPAGQGLWPHSSTGNPSVTPGESPDLPGGPTSGESTVPPIGPAPGPASTPAASPAAGLAAGPTASPGGTAHVPGGSSAGAPGGDPGNPATGPPGLLGQGLGGPRDPAGVSGRTYVVRPGDSLWAIAKRFGTTVEAIVAANNIATPELIYPGDILRVP